MLVVWIIISVITLPAIYLLFAPITVRLNILIDQKISAVSAIKIFPFEYKFVSEKPKKPNKKKVKLEEAREAIPEKAGEERKFRFSILARADFMVIFELLVETLRFTGRIISSPHYFLRAEIAGGASEPDITGELYGAYHAIRFVLPGSISINYIPDFAAEKFRGTVEVGLVIRLFKLFKETLILFYRLPIIRLIKIYRKLKKGA